MQNHCVVFEDGSKCYFQGDHLHREDGPAIEYANGDRRWYLNNRLHREDGPAIDVVNGTKSWYKDGILHRKDGPAIERPNGTKSWYFKGIYVGEGDHPDPDLWERLTSVELNGGPLLNGCIVDLEGYTWSYKDDQLHREDGPAVEWPDGSVVWCFNGRQLDWGAEGFWCLWDRLTDEQRGNPTLLKWMPH